jgi:phage tail-like protein
MSQFVAQKANPMASYRFTVQFASSLFVDAGFSRVSGLNIAADQITYREGGQTPTVRKFPGLTMYNDLRLDRGAAANMDMYTWASQCFVINPSATPLADDYTPDGFRQNLVINGLANNNSSVVRSWQVLNAWPKEVNMGDFDAQASSVLIETLVIAHEGVIPAAGPLGSGAGTAGVPQVQVGINAVVNV